MKSIYKYYKERLIEISGRNRSLYSKNVSKKYAFDLGPIFYNEPQKLKEFLDFLWKGKKYSFTLLDNACAESLAKNFKLEDKVRKKYEFKKLKGIDNPDAQITLDASDQQKLNKALKDEKEQLLKSQVNALTLLKREIEEFSKETGRYEMYVGYPFVQGSINRDLVIKAPLILFPVTIEIKNETTVNILLKHDEPIQFNKVLILAYAKEHNIILDDISLEYDNLPDYNLNEVKDVLDYLLRFDIKINPTITQGVAPYNTGAEPVAGEKLTIAPYCVLGRFPLANNIYNDYTYLEKKKLSSTAIDELLEGKNIKPVKHPNTNLYNINRLDYAQRNAIYELNTKGNMVVFGPPGTGKSQTIVNIISDALTKGKRVLVVSQKRAALDVVYNRLGTLNQKAVIIPDAEKDKVAFYERTKASHSSIMSRPFKEVTDNYDDIQQKIDKEVADLNTISQVLFTKTKFGLTLQQMYANSHIIGKNSNDYLLLNAMQQDKKLMSYDYATLSDALRTIKEKNKAELYYKHLEIQRTNPLVNHINTNLDSHQINQARMLLNNVLSKRLVPFDTGGYQNSRQMLAFYLENNLSSKSDLKPLIKYVSKLNNPTLYKKLNASKLLFFTYPFVKRKTDNKEREIYNNFLKTLDNVNEYLKDYEILKVVLDERGYATTVDNILNGNTIFLKLLQKALDSYVEIRDINLAIKDATEVENSLLNFAYTNSNSLSGYKAVLDKFITIRIYHEVVRAEDEHREELGKIMDFNNIRNRIISLNNEQMKVVKDACIESFAQKYTTLYNNGQDSKDFLYQISKQQGLWPIRKLMEHYTEYLLTLFPCWLLSPENVSTIMPLKSGLFDIILFDEASQVFIENTVPVIFRGKYIVVAGDNKQLRPTATFVRRYMGNDDDTLSVTTQAALEVESLLDLATSRYQNVNLTYHYRSVSEELINFSNYAFYDGKLQIAPNISKNDNKKPIERVKVDGKWIDRHNRAEALQVVKTVKKIFATRKNNETIGIITFNTEQENYIEDMLDEECKKDSKFRDSFLAECNRKVNGEDISLFIKNLENVQGDERDIIIFCIGYAQNEYGRVVAQFGPLSLEGGENRLNVAITRARRKIYVITSIEPEELNVENTKNAGPKFLKKYLQYVRAVSNNNTKEMGYILSNLQAVEPTQTIDNTLVGLSAEVKAELEKLGYTVEANLGHAKYKLSLGVYDSKIDRYVLGIEFDDMAYYSSNSLLERDVYRYEFLQSRGWNIFRLWARDWWQNKQKVLQAIVKSIEKTNTKNSK